MRPLPPFGRLSPSARGDGLTPAVQMTVREGMYSPPAATPVSSTRSTGQPRLTSPPLALPRRRVLPPCRDRRSRHALDGPFPPRLHALRPETLQRPSGEAPRQPRKNIRPGLPKQPADIRARNTRILPRGRPSHEPLDGS